MWDGKRHKSKPDCGTRSGYDWHRRDQLEEPCFECREAETLYWRNQRLLRKDIINGNAKIRRMNNPGANRSNRKRAIKFGVATEWYSPQQILDIYGTNCHICNIPIDLNAPRQTGKLGWEYGLQIDHVYPLSKGGTDTIDNLRPSHGYCNNVKNATVDYQRKFSGNQEITS